LVADGEDASVSPVFSAQSALETLHDNKLDKLIQYNIIQYNTIQCSSAQSTTTWPTVHYNVSEYMG